MGPVVIDDRHPFPDDRLELVQKEERFSCRVEAARVDVRALVTGKRLQQALSHRPEEPLDRTLVPARPQPGWLNRDAHPPADTGHVLGDIDLAMIDHDGLRHQRWARQLRHLVSAVGVPVHQHPARNAVVGPERVGWPALVRRARPERLEEARADVNGLRRDRRDPQTRDAAGVPVHRHRDLGLHPPQGDRVQCEHIRTRRVQQQILARPGGSQPVVSRIRLVCGLPASLRAAPERWNPPVQLLKQTVGRGPARHLHRIGPEPSGQTSRGAFDDDRLRRTRLFGVLGHDLQGHLHPAWISTLQLPLAAGLHARCQSGRTEILVFRNPSLQRPARHAQFGSFGGVATGDRQVRVEALAGLAEASRLGRAQPIPR